MDHSNNISRHFILRTGLAQFEPQPKWWKWSKSHENGLGGIAFGKVSQSSVGPLKLPLIHLLFFAAPLPQPCLTFLTSLPLPVKTECTLLLSQSLSHEAGRRDGAVYHTVAACADQWAQGKKRRGTVAVHSPTPLTHWALEGGSHGASWGLRWVPARDKLKPTDLTYLYVGMFQSPCHLYVFRESHPKVFIPQ